MNLKECHNFSDFRKLAKQKLPSPIFHYIDGAADDEITYQRNSSAFDARKQHILKQQRSIADKLFVA